MYVVSARPFENHLCERLPCLKIINNNNNNTGVGLFADDTKLYKAVQNPSDALVLQEDIRSLQSWSEENRLRFNNSKCKVLSITRKSSPLITSYSLDGQQLALSNTEIDLIDSRTHHSSASRPPRVINASLRTLRNPPVHHISITPRCSSSTTGRKMNDLLRDAIVNLQTYFSGSERTVIAS